MATVPVGVVDVAYRYRVSVMDADTVVRMIDVAEYQTA